MHSLNYSMFLRFVLLLVLLFVRCYFFCSIFFSFFFRLFSSFNFFIHFFVLGICSSAFVLLHLFYRICSCNSHWNILFVSVLVTMNAKFIVSMFLTYLSLMPHFHFVETIDITPRIAACIFLFLHSNSITYPKQIEIERSNSIQIVQVQRYAKKERKKQTPTFRIRHRAISFSICWETNFLRISILLFFFLLYSTN